MRHPPMQLEGVREDLTYAWYTDRGLGLETGVRTKIHWYWSCEFTERRLKVCSEPTARMNTYEMNVCKGSTPEDPVELSQADESDSSFAHRTDLCGSQPVDLFETGKTLKNRSVSENYKLAVVR